MYTREVTTWLLSLSAAVVISPPFGAGLAGIIICVGLLITRIQMIFTGIQEDGRNSLVTTLAVKQLLDEKHWQIVLNFLSQAPYNLFSILQIEELLTTSFIPSEWNC